MKSEGVNIQETEKVILSLVEYHLLIDMFKH